MRCLRPALDACPTQYAGTTRGMMVEGAARAPCAGAVAVDVEGDAELQQKPLGSMLVAQQLAVGQRLDNLLHQLEVRPRHTVLLEHLVVKAFGLVCRELHSPVRNTRL